MTRLLSLRLSGFRSHRSARLTFDGRPVAIFGANGAGKTNLVEAVSLLSPGRGLRRAAADDLIGRPDGLGWKVVAEIEASSARHEIETWAEPGSPRQLRIDGKAAPQLILGRLVPMLWLVPAMDRLWTEAADGRRRFLDRAALSFVPAHAEAALGYDKAMRQRNRLLRDGVGDARWYEALEVQMARAGAAVAANRAAAVERLNAAQRGAATSFPAADLALVGPDGEAAEVPDEARLATALARSRPADLRAGRSLAGPHRDDLHAVWRAKGVPAAQCSTGEQKALLISLILANARALAAARGDGSGAAPILLLDEVAAHLDARRRAALYDEILQLGAQAFLTGTGAELFEALGARGRRLRIEEVDGRSRIEDVDAGGSAGRDG